MIAVEVSKNAKDFDCKTCARKHCDHDGDFPGSIGPAPFPLFEIPGVIASPVCLLPMISDFSRECLRLFSHYKNGYLLTAGGLYDQPRKYLKAMELIDGYTARN